MEGGTEVNRERGYEFSLLLLNLHYKWIEVSLFTDAKLTGTIQKKFIYSEIILRDSEIWAKKDRQ